MRSISGSRRSSIYIIDNWGGVPDNPVLFTCYDEADIEQQLKNTGFTEAAFFHTESSVYANIPRLLERGVSGYQLIAIAE